MHHSNYISISSTHVSANEPSLTLAAGALKQTSRSVCADGVQKNIIKPRFGHFMFIVHLRKSKQRHDST